MNRRYSRQSFLGADSEYIIRTAKIGIVGLSGGGSHQVQQLGHVGFRRFVLYDPERFDDMSNLNRNVLATVGDLDDQPLKTSLAARALGKLAESDLELECYPCRWQDKPEPLRACDLIFGCVDTFAQRAELEVCARRHLIPYLDIGLDVTIVEGERPRMGGQLIVSMPGDPCMRCLGFLTEERLAREAAQYGNVGARPQVVWGNGVLASTAVGIAVDLLTNWSGALHGPVYLSYDGSRATMAPHVRLEFLGSSPCPHFPSDAVGEPRFAAL